MTLPQLIQRLRDSQASNETICNVMHVWQQEKKHKIHPPVLSEFFAQCCLAVGANVVTAKSKSRHRVNVRARNLFAYYLRTNFEAAYSLREIGEFLDGRDHTSAIHAKESFRDLLSTDDPVTVHDLSNLNLILIGGSPIPLIKQPHVPKPIKWIHVYHEKKIDKYFRDIKSIRHWHGFSKHVRINPYRFRPRVVMLEKIKELDYFEV